MFDKLFLEGWRQFRKVEINFHPRLTILTGANGAGKTTLLGMVSRHFGWNNQFVSTPKGRTNSEQLTYSADFWFLKDKGSGKYWLVNEHDKLWLTSDDDSEHWFTSEDNQPIPIFDKNSSNAAVQLGPRTEIGSVKYSNGVSSPISVPTGQTGYVYDVQIDNQQPVEGLHIPSHRPTYSYQQVQNIPTVPRRRKDVFQNYLNLIRTRYAGGHTQWSPQYYMKETLIALATFGYGNAAVEADAESAKIFEEFQEVLRRMLPPKLGFKNLSVRVPEIILETATGPFSIDALSGGAAAVIDLAWQIFMYQPAGSQFVVTLDEPENHLHPELQRRVLADLLQAFPSVQFIVATHSPFIVGSVPDSHVYVLDYDPAHKVRSTLLDTVNKAGTANEILRDVLGLDFTMPIWVEAKLDEIVGRYTQREFDAETLSDLRQEMDTIGLGKHAPATIAKIAELKDRQ